MSYETLTDNQKAGIDHNASHNGMELDAYLDRLMANDGERGYRELVQAQMAGITTKLVSEPTILAEVEAVVDEKIETIAVAKEAAALEAAKEPVEEIV